MLWGSSPFTIFFLFFFSNLLCLTPLLSSSPFVCMSSFSFFFISNQLYFIVLLFFPLVQLPERYNLFIYLFIYSSYIFSLSLGFSHLYIFSFSVGYFFFFSPFLYIVGIFTSFISVFCVSCLSFFIRHNGFFRLQQYQERSTWTSRGKFLRTQVMFIFVEGRREFLLSCVICLLLLQISPHLQINLSQKYAHTHTNIHG